MLVMSLVMCLVGCYKDHLYVQQEWVNDKWLASSKVGTPDPRKGRVQDAERLLIAWDFPKSLFDEGLTLLVTVRLWNNTEQFLKIPVERKRYYDALTFPCKDRDLRILTYRIQVENNTGQIIETWKHHFWTELIVMDRMRSSVSSQPKQGSVMETP